MFILFRVLPSRFCCFACRFYFQSRGSVFRNYQRAANPRSSQSFWVIRRSFLPRQRFQTLPTCSLLCGLPSHLGWDSVHFNFSFTRKAFSGTSNVQPILGTCLSLLMDPNSFQLFCQSGSVFSHFLCAAYSKNFLVVLGLFQVVLPFQYPGQRFPL